MRDERSVDADLKGELNVLAPSGGTAWGGGDVPNRVEARELRNGSRHPLRLDSHVSPLSSPPHPPGSPLELPYCNHLISSAKSLKLTAGNRSGLLMASDQGLYNVSGKTVV